MGRAVGAFYHEVVASGIRQDVAIEMAKDYARAIRQARQDAMRNLEIGRAGQSDHGSPPADDSPP